MQDVEIIITAIDCVRLEAKKAVAEGNMFKYQELMLNLTALEACLVIEVKKLLKAA